MQKLISERMPLIVCVCLCVSFSSCAGDISKPLKWEDISAPQIGVEQVELRTRWHDGKIHYQIEMRPVPRGFNSGFVGLARDFLKNPAFTVFFRDGDDFSVLEVSLLERDFSRIVDAEGVTVGLASELRYYLSKDLHFIAAA